MSRNMVKIVGCIILCMLFVISIHSSAANVENIRSSPPKDFIGDNMWPDPSKIEDPISGKSGDGIITLDPEDPNGKCGWYVTPVKVTFHAHDNLRLHYIYWRVITNDVEDPFTKVDIRDEKTANYDLTITLSEDGRHIVEFYAVDHVNNTGPIHSSKEIKIDMTLPTVTLTKEKIKITTYKFTANVDDATSGFFAIEVYLDDVFQRAYMGSLPYVWSWRMGIEKHTVKVIAYDYAGNTASSSTSTQCSQHSDSQQSDNAPSLFTQLLQRIFGHSTVPDAQTPTSTPMFLIIRELLSGLR